jgi:tetratricopeptide (TPR) repeat protein
MNTATVFRYVVVIQLMCWFPHALLAQEHTFIEADAPDQVMLAQRAAEHVQAGRLDAALVDLNAALSIAPNDRLVMNRANVLVRLGRAPEAIVEYTSFLTRSTEFRATAYFNRSLAYAALDDVHSALADRAAARAALTARPFDARSLNIDTFDATANPGQ